MLFVFGWMGVIILRNCWFIGIMVFSSLKVFMLGLWNVGFSLNIVCRLLSIGANSYVISVI